MLFRNKAGNVYKSATTQAEINKLEAQGMIRAEEKPTKNIEKSAEKPIETKTNETVKPKPKATTNKNKAVKMSANGNKD